MKKLFVALSICMILLSCNRSPNSENYDEAKSELGLMDKAYEPLEEEMMIQEEENRPEYVSSSGSEGTFAVTMNGAASTWTSYAYADDNSVSVSTPAPKAKKELVKKIIKKGQMGYETSDYGAEMTRIKGLVAKYEGYVSNENEENSNYNIRNDLVIRMPAEHLDKFMDELTSGVKRIDYKRVSAQDVTEEFVDLQARLKTKKEAEDRFIEILRKAKTIEEILQVENQLRGIREEIEAKEGRLKYLQDLVEMSTLSLNVYQKLDYKYIPPKGKGFFARMAKALDGGWNGLLSLIIGLTNLWPFWLILAGVALFLRRFLKMRKERRD